jgi:hypothetical protein
MVREGIILGHLVSERGIEVDKAKIEVIEQLPPPVNIKGIRSFFRTCRFLSMFHKGLLSNFLTFNKPVS